LNKPTHFAINIYDLCLKGRIPESWLRGTESWLRGTESWLRGTESWLRGTESWLRGTESWLRIQKSLFHYQKIKISKPVFYQAAYHSSFDI